MKTRYGKIAGYFLLPTVFVGLAFISMASAGLWFQTTQLTNNAVDDLRPQISGNTAVWHGEVDSRYEVFKYDGASVTTLSVGPFTDSDPQISGNNIVWSGSDGADLEIFRFNGSTITTITNNSLDDQQPQVSGNNIVWTANDGDDEIFHYNGSTVTTLTDNASMDADHRISGNNVVWRGNGGGDYEIFRYNGSAVTTITNNSFDDGQPQVSGDNIVWVGHEGIWYHIMRYDGSAVTTVTSSLFVGGPQVSGNNVVWIGTDTFDLEIFHYNGSKVTTITNNNFHDYDPQVSGNNVVWYGYEGGDDSEIFHFDGSTVTTLTANDFDDEYPQISGNKVVWSGKKGSSTISEIFTAVLDQEAPQDPSATSLSHTPGAWSRDNTVDIKLSGAADGVSGVDGFSFAWTNVATTLPDAVKDAEESSTALTSPALANGSWYFHLRTLDNAGHWTSTIHYGPFKIDAARPASKVISPPYSTRVSKTTDFTVYWSGKDSTPSSGIASHQVQYKISRFGKWTNWLSATKLTKSVFKGAAGRTYFFRSRAKDNAGNTGAWSAERRTVVPYNEGSNIKSHKGFAAAFSKASSPFYKGTVRYAKKRGASITYAVTGKSVALISTLAKSRSKAKIYLDGKYVKTVDAYKSGTIAHRRVLFSKTWLKGGKHTLRVVNLATPGRARFDIDGIGVGR